MSPDDAANLPAIYPGNFRSVCLQPDCHWWREVPPKGVGPLIQEAHEHRAAHRAADAEEATA